MLSFCVYSGRDNPNLSSPEGPDGPQKPNDNGTYPLDYPHPIPDIKKFIDLMPYCHQYMEYQCLVSHNLHMIFLNTVSLK